MKIKGITHWLPPAVLGLGLLGTGIRALMFALCVDEKGLLIPWNLPWVLTWVLCAAAMLLVTITVGKAEGSGKYAHNFPQSTLAGAGSFFAAIGIILLLVLQLDTVYDSLGTAWMVGGIAAVPCLLFVGLCRIKGWKPHYLFDGVLCLYFCLSLAHHYRLWSGEPEADYYLWELLGSCGLALTAFFRASFAARLPKRRRLLNTGLLAAFCCMLAIPGEEHVYWLLMALWGLTNVCEMEVPPEEPPAEEASEEADGEAPEEAPEEGAEEAPGEAP